MGKSNQITRKIDMLKKDERSLQQQKNKKWRDPSSDISS